MIEEFESVAKTDPKSVDNTLKPDWLFSQCDQLYATPVIEGINQ